MPRRKAWHGQPPATHAAARRRLLDAAITMVERLGSTRVGLTDVAEEAGVTRQTVYRYFRDADDLFRSAAALSSGGFLERLRSNAHQEATLEARIIACVVFAIRELPSDPWLGNLGDGRFTPSSLVDLGFVQEEITHLAHGVRLPRAVLDPLAELLVRVLHSFLTDAGPPRSETALRDTLTSWLAPAISEALLHAKNV